MSRVERSIINLIAATYVLTWLLALGAADAIREVERGSADGRVKGIGDA